MFLDDKVIKIISDNNDYSPEGLTKTYTLVIREFEEYLISQIKGGMTFKEFAVLFDKSYNFELLIIKKLKNSKDNYMINFAVFFEEITYTKDIMNHNPRFKKMYIQGGGTLLLKNKQ